MEPYQTIENEEKSKDLQDKPLQTVKIDTQKDVLKYYNFEG